MTNIERKFSKSFSTNWLSAVRFAERRRIRLTTPTNGNLYHYGANNPITYVEPTGREAGFLTDSDSVPFAGHSAMYVEVYKENRESDGFELYEVGIVNEGEDGVLSSEHLDPSMGIVAGSVSGASGAGEKI